MERLHAKCFFTDNEAIVTSMNLVGTSAQNSWEVGVHVRRQQHPEMFTQAKAMYGDLLTRIRNEEATIAAEGAAAAPASRPAKKARGATRQKKKAKPKVADGTCIRCGDHVKLDPAHPLCRDCYTTWAKYEDDTYEESYCHTCGDEVSTSKAKPVCRPCWRASK